MTDPYNNPYAAPASASPVAAPRMQKSSVDAIARLQVSETWKDRFYVIEKAGGVAMNRARQLDSSARRKVGINWLAFLFGPFYLLAKGLWRQALSWILIWIVVVLACVLMHWEGILRPAGIGLSMMYAMRANVGYYARMVLGEPIWF
jgi:hypothetical protein